MTAFADPILPPAEDWDALRARFRWPRPARFNIAEAICGRWARTAPQRTALVYVRPDGARRDWTFLQLDRAAGRLANALRGHGIARGDRVAVLLPQTPEALLTHLACYRIGAVAVPLFTLFGEDGLRHRIGDAGAKAVVTDEADLPKIAAIRADLPALTTVFSIDRAGEGAWGFWQELGKAAEGGPMADTGPDDPAFISYTSGTTGPPKGALHAHRVLIGHLPGFCAHHDLGPKPGDLYWTPADWAWMGGLANVLLPALFHGMPVVAHRMAKFDPERAFALMADLGVRNVFMPPTALRLLAQVPDPGRFGARLRSAGSGGEAMGASMLDWGRGALGLQINEFYGQTEANLVLGNCGAMFPARPGSTGRATPGSEVAVLDAAGRALPDGEVGEIAIREGAPQMFLGYWNMPEKTADKFHDGPDGRWLRTGDEGARDPEGFFRFSARSDDVITTSGYRVGPSEIEDCIATHPWVAMAGVIGVPDEMRTEAVRAFVVPTPEGAAQSAEALAEAVIAHVRERLSPHLAPRGVEAVESLPTTATGKIMRRELKAKALADG